MALLREFTILQERVHNVLAVIKRPVDFEVVDVRSLAGIELLSLEFAHTTFWRQENQLHAFFPSKSRGGSCPHIPSTCP